MVLIMYFIVKYQLYQCFDVNNLFSSSQFDSTSNRSTLKAIEKLENKILYVFDQKKSL